MKCVSQEHTSHPWFKRSISIAVSFFLVLLMFTSLFAFSGPTMVKGVELNSPTEEEKNMWVAQFWNWRVAQPSPEQGGCLVNSTQSVVMLMETAQEDQIVRDPIEQKCNISTDQGIMIPLWAAWCDTAIPDHRDFRGPRLAQCAREEYNLGHIQSNVMVNGTKVATLNALMNIPPGTPKYISEPANVTEFSSNQFNIFIPPSTPKGEQGSGNFPAGSHGWWVFLKPLPPGEHTISYNTRVDPVTADVAVLGADNITYSFVVT